MFIATCHTVIKGYTTQQNYLTTDIELIFQLRVISMTMHTGYFVAILVCLLVAVRLMYLVQPIFLSHFFFFTRYKVKITKVINSIL